VTLEYRRRRAESAHGDTERGMTMVELLVAMGIGVGVTLATTTLLISGENHKRTTTSTNDAEQTGAYAFYELDQAIRGAGSGFASTAFGKSKGVLACKLYAAPVLPPAGALPDPFGTPAFQATSADLRMVPVLIAPSQSQGGSDVLVVMNGSGAAGGVPRQIAGPGDATTLALDNTVGFVTNDLLLVSQSGGPVGADCLLEQVNKVVGSTLLLGGAYYTAGTNTTMQNLASDTTNYVTPLGNATANNLQLTLYGVGNNRILYSYDLLQNLKVVQGSGANTSQAIADGVDQLHAIYGLDTTAATGAGTGIQNAWAAPTDAGWDPATVRGDPTRMLQIISVRVALVLRSSYYDKNVVSPPTLTLFQGLTNATNTPLQQVVALNPVDQHYRYRVFEFTVPVRNMLLID
jgi:type IV pilus assembly protein PilW